MSRKDKARWGHGSEGSTPGRPGAAGSGVETGGAGASGGGGGGTARGEAATPGADRYMTGGRRSVSSSAARWARRKAKVAGRLEWEEAMDEPGEGAT